MRETAENVRTPPFIDLKNGYLGDYAHFAKFHADVSLLAFECGECKTPEGTPERWVQPWGDSDGPDDGGGVFHRFVVCPSCGSFKSVKFLMVYPWVPRHKQNWFWDMSTYSKRYEKK